MAQIKKAKRGTELNLIKNLNAEIDNLLNDQNIDEKLKADARAVLQFSQQVINQEEFTPRDKRIYQLGIAQKVNLILKGELAYSESMTGDAEKNIFGFYNRKSELPWIVNETVKRVLGSAKSNSLLEYQNSTLNSDQIPFKTRISFDPSSGFNSHTLAETTTDQKIKRFANHLISQLTDYSSKDQNQYIIDGLSEKGLSNIPKSLSTLLSMISRETTDNDILTLGDIVSTLGNDNLTSLYESYFADKLDLSNDPKYSTGNRLITEGTYKDNNITTYLKNKGYKVFNNNGSSYLLKADGTPATTFAEIDPTSPYYKHAFIIDSNGLIIDSGNLKDPDVINRFGSDTYLALVKYITDNYKSKFPTVDYTSQGGLRGIDLSNYYNDKIDGKDVIHFIPDSEYDYTSEFTPWLFDNRNLTGFNFNGNIELDENNRQKLHQYAVSHGFDPDLNISDILNPDWNIIKKYLITDSAFTKIFENNQSLENVINYLSDIIISSDKNNPNKEEALNRLNSIYPNGNKTTSNNESYKNIFIRRLSEPENIDILKLLLAAAIRKAQTSENRWSLIKSYKLLTDTQSRKEGGILLLKTGGVEWANSLGVRENTSSQPYSEQSSSEFNPISKTIKREQEDGFEWKWEDTLRCLSLTADIAGILSSNAVGFGTLGAGIAGLTSTGLDYWADSIDKTVNDNERRANLGLGLGATAVGLIPDAKALTTGSKAVKFLAGLGRRSAQGLAVLGTFGVAKEDYEKIKKACEDPNHQFSGDDLKAIFNTLRILSTAILTRRVSNKHRNISEGITQENRTFTTKGKDGKLTEVPLSETNFDLIISTGKSKGLKEANVLFRSFAGDKVADDAEFPTSFGDTWVTRWLYNLKHNTGYALPGYPSQISYSGQGKLNIDPEITIDPKDLKGVDIPMSTWDKARFFNWDIDFGKVGKWYGKIMHPKYGKNKSKKRDGGRLERLTFYINK